VQFDIIGLSCKRQRSPQRWKENFDDLAARYPQYGLLAAEYSYHNRELNDVVYSAPTPRPPRHRQLHLGTHSPSRSHLRPAPAATSGPTTVAARRPSSALGRFDTNDLINLYPQISKHVAGSESVPDP